MVATSMHRTAAAATAQRRTAAAAAAPLATAVLLGAVALISLAGPGLPAAAAETLVATEIAAVASAVRTTSADEAAVSAFSGAKLTFSSSPSPETKGQVTLNVKAGDTVNVDLQKAWVKARLDAVRLTIGKTRLSWGEGALFNAGNVIFGDTAVDLSAEDLRDDNAWLAAANLPLGDFSFLEAVVLPPVLSAEGGGPENSSFGGRAYTRLGGVKMEAGYLRSGESVDRAVPAAHEPYFSLQGNAWADWHLSSSASVRGTALAPSAEDWTISSGLYRQWSVPAADDGSGDSVLGTFALRLEASIRPDGSWTAETIQAAPAGPTALAGGATSLDSPYALLLYPELSWRADTVLLLARSLVSPMDLSALSAVSVQWAPLEGLRLIGSVAVQSGQADDLFSWDRPGAWQATVVSRFSF